MGGQRQVRPPLNPAGPALAEPWEGLSPAGPEVPSAIGRVNLGLYLALVKTKRSHSEGNLYELSVSNPRKFYKYNDFVEDENFPTLLTRLRSQRGLSQARLSQLAGVSNATVHRAELARGKVPSARIALQLFKAMDDVTRVSVRDLCRYAELAKVDPATLDRSGRVAAIQAAAKPISEQLRSIARHVKGWNDAIDALPSEWREPVRKVAALVDHLGHQRTMDILLGVTAAVAVIDATDEGETTIDVAHPPRDADVEAATTVEQVTTRYAKRAALRRNDRGKNAG